MQLFQDCGRPPSWISILGHNFCVDQHFCTKFGTVMENLQPKSPIAQKSDFPKSKIADGCHLEFQKVIITQLWIEIYA